VTSGFAANPSLEGEAGAFADGVFVAGVLVPHAVRASVNTKIITTRNASFFM
jgi:hypothetical protein